MTKAELQAAALAAKDAKGLTWEQLGEACGVGKVFVASCCYGESSMSEESATKLAGALGLGPEAIAALQGFATKGWTLGDKTVPTDPLIYRFYEIMAVYGASVKDVVQEEFGDGIMSAIDFKLDVTREKDPKGDRVVITMNGKFLPYKKW